MIDPIVFVLRPLNKYPEFVSKWLPSGLIVLEPLTVFAWSVWG